MYFCVQNAYFIKQHQNAYFWCLHDLKVQLLEFGIKSLKSYFRDTDHVWNQKIGLLMLLDKIYVLDAKKHYFPEKSKIKTF